MSGGSWVANGPILKEGHRLYLVTVKLPKIPGHNPVSKQSGRCQCEINEHCTDKTGQHHTVAVSAPDINRAEQAVRDRGYTHITRVEVCWVIETH